MLRYKIYAWTCNVCMRVAASFIHTNMPTNWNRRVNPPYDHYASPLSSFPPPASPPLPSVLLSLPTPPIPPSLPRSGPQIQLGGSGRVLWVPPGRKSILGTFWPQKSCLVSTILVLPLCWAINTNPPSDVLKMPPPLVIHYTFWA